MIQGGSSGLGRSLTKIYAARGCPIVVTGLEEPDLQSLVKECGNEFANFNVFYIAGDCTNEDDCKRIVDFMI